ncbi:hypothetical protein [Colwellia sp. Bg11-12]|jgi:hypothetical protein|uniref:hypothetical protein n=1 Tax=Colwellia sp. Bg11-12 TaxID=2759817 RepID=UPI0015F4C526|nr:hypothetical protein [Colwellia sp. Bg11-12]MBA6264000.1 hypothetical protein [Colwellia sp. Bg11-12]
MSIGLKLMNKVNYKLICLSALLTCNVIAQDDHSAEPLKIHGFVAQGVIDVDGSNFVNDDGELSLKLTEIGLNTSYQLSDDFRFAAQAVYLNGGNRYNEGLRVDYFLVDWNAYSSEQLQANLFVGRFKNAHWLHSSTRDIPFARPSIILPQGTYFDGFRDIAIGGDGAALKITYNNDEYGEFDFNFSRGKSPINSDDSEVILSRLAQGSIESELDTQASVYWRPVFSQWKFGLSLLDSEFNYHKEAVDFFVDGRFVFQFYTMNALYEGEQWEFTSEILQTRFLTEGFYTQPFNQDSIGQGGYFQARYKVDQQLTLIGRYEKFYIDKNDKRGHKLQEQSAGLVPSYFGYQDDAMIGFSYNFSDNFRVNAEYHWVKGTARLNPIVLPNPQANSEHWKMWAVQLMYWF